MATRFFHLNNRSLNPAVVAWFVKGSVFYLVNSAPSANGESNPAWVINMVANAPAVRIIHRNKSRKKVIQKSYSKFFIENAKSLTP